MVHQCIFVLIFTYFALIANIRGLDSEISDSTQASYDNLDADLTPIQIIKKYGYPSEAHAVKSKDGYILELHRIPYGKAGPGDKKRIPIFLHHGLLSSSIDWIINGPNKSLGYRLADEGYDVWMANARGNTFSRQHVKYSPKQKEFWNYSFHEMAFYDLPAAIDHILETTEEKQLIYIGFSMGTTVFYAMASTLPEYQKKIKFQISLAPVSAIPHTNSAARLLISYVDQINKAADWYSNGAFLEHDLIAKTLGPFFCGASNTSNNDNFCKKYIFFGIFGKNPEQFDDNLLPVISNNFPAGTSCKNMIHFSQLISSGTFAQFNYERAENMKRYGSYIPPKYKINKIRVPMRFYYSDNDLLSTPLDTKLLYQNIAKPLGLKRVNLDKFSHIDFLWAKDINRLLNDEIIEFINNSTNHNSKGSSNFIQNTITEALDTRKNTPVPVNVPFDEKSFLVNVGKDFLGNVYDNIDNAVGNAISDSIKKIQAGGEKIRTYFEDLLKG
ncbi:gastric triacylglycerol lipase-like [Planococcus citri]|uniref:gastric triacylglycerol lipase-like n=1 Tax=Planococcus citri TaxID=170843 RepID=UPI0031F8F716